MKKMTVGKFVENGLLKRGKLLILEDGDSLLIGDATLYCQDTTSDGGIGWDWGDDRVIVEVRDVNLFKGTQ